MTMIFKRLAAAAVVAALCSFSFCEPSRADDAAPQSSSSAQGTAGSSPAAASSGQPATTPAQAPSPSSPAQAQSGQSGATPAQPPAAPAPSAPASGQAAPGEPSQTQGEGSTGETVDLPARSFAFIEGKADRDEIYGSIRGSLGLVRREIEKAGLKPAGNPLAVFVESDDSGFRYHAGYPLESPEGKTGLSDAVKIGQTPIGKAMRFQHLGSYADIDATYDAITAYLDEKGVDAQDSFIEEYANDVKDADDPNLQVNIYVLLK